MGVFMNSENSSSFPKSVQIQTSNKCNAACTFCPYPYTESKKSFQLMDWKLYTKIIDECAKHEVEQILPFFLNEPLLNNKLIKYIDYAKEKNPNSLIKIFTNGSLLTEKNSRQLLNSKIDEVIFSFNGSTKEEYESLMKGLDYNKTRDRISKFIKICSENKNPKVAVHLLKTGLSESSLFKLRDYWNSLGVAVHILKYENRAGNVKDYDISSDSKIKKIPCSRLLNQIYILVNGDVIICCADWKNEVVFGNLNESSIFDVWNGQKRTEYLKAHLNNNFNNLKLCDICNFNEIIFD